MSKFSEDLEKLDADILNRQKIQQEHDEFEKGLNKLTAFLRLENSRNNISESQYTLLLQQHGIMYMYLNILEWRIEELKQND